MTSLYLFAATTAPGTMSSVVRGSFSTAMEQIQADVFDLMGVALPYALGIMGVFLAVRLGISFFRSVAH